MDTNSSPQLGQIYKYVPISQSLLISLFGFLAIIFGYGLRHSTDVLLIKPCPDNRQTSENLYNEGQTLFSEVCRSVSDHLMLPQLGEYLPNGEFRKFFAKNCSQITVKPLEAVNSPFSNLQSFATLAFYIGYLITHIPAGILADAYGGKWVLACSMAAVALMSLSTPAIVRGNGLKGLLLVRFLMGLFEGPLFPSLCALMSQWVPEEKRATLCSIVLGAGHIGVLIVNLLIGYLTPQYQWAHILQFFGVCTLLWLLLFITLCCNEPGHYQAVQATGSSPSTTSHRSQDIQPQTVMCTTRRKLPWSDMLSCRPVWALITATIQQSWTENLFIREIIGILSDLKCSQLWNNLSMILQVLIPFMLNWLISLGSGVMSDILVNRNILDATSCRRIITFMAAFGPKICTMFANACFYYNSDLDHISLSNVFSNLLSAIGVYYAGIQLTAIDLSPNYAGTLMAIANSFGAVFNILMPYISSYINNSESLSSCIRTVTWLFCILFTSGDVQSFDSRAAIKYD